MIYIKEKQLSLELTKMITDVNEFLKESPKEIPRIIGDRIDRND